MKSLGGNNSIEPRFVKKVDEGLDFGKAYTKAQAVLKDKPDEFDFGDKYERQEIAQDVDRVIRLKEKFKKERERKETKQMSTILEAIIFEQGELGEWFGENSFTIGVSEFDDFVNGIDMVVEFHEQDDLEMPPLELGIDVTFTNDTTPKFDGLKEQIENGELSTIKYFCDSTDVRGKKENVPEVIIGVSGKTTNELTQLWLEKDHDALPKYRIQIMILEQIRVQLIAFMSYAKLCDKDDLADIYESRLQVVNKIIAKKKELYDEVIPELDEDPVYFAIINYIREWQRDMDEQIKAKKKGQQSTTSHTKGRIPEGFTGKDVPSSGYY